MKKSIYHLLPVLILLVTACSSKEVSTSAYNINPLAYTHVDTTDRMQLENMYKFKSSKDKQSSSEVNPMRIEGLKEAAITLGAQGALAYRSRELDKFLEENAAHLNQIYNFQALVLDNNVLPPVITEARDQLVLHDNDTIQIADKTYTILKNVRFVTTPPNWREYLWLKFNKPELPDPSILPKEDSEPERDLWKQFVDEGWEQGLQQANTIFSENLAKLQRDYQGMMRYRKLLNEHVINSPMVAKVQLGITGGGESLAINDQLLRITVHPELNANSEEWLPIVTQPFMGVANNTAIDEDREMKTPMEMEPNYYVK
jgi:defect in organelle trafficking protein DotC